MSYDPVKWGMGAQRDRKRTRYAVWLIGFGIILVLYSAISAPFKPNLDPFAIRSVFPAFLPIIAGTLLSPFARDRFDMKFSDSQYDEFENAAIMRATTHSYGYLLLIMVMLCAWCGLGKLYAFPSPSSSYDWSAVGIAFIFIGPVLPVFITELMVPMPPKEDG